MVGTELAPALESRPLNALLKVLDEPIASSPACHLESRSNCPRLLRWGLIVCVIADVASIPHMRDQRT